MTSPSTINRCAITVQAIDAQVPAQGGAGSITVGAARDCTWTATAEAQWLSIRGGSNGQGDGTVQFAASPNPDPSTRRGAVVLNGQRAEITQAAADCAFSLGESAASFGQAGGSGTIPVRASSSLCAWTASADADWITLRSTRGTGTGPLVFDVVPTTGPPRSGTVTVAGQKFSVTQAEGCSYAIAPSAQTVQPSGGSGSIAVTAPAACPWTAASNVEWLSVAPLSGSGPGAVTFSVAAAPGPSRTGTAIVAGQTFTVTQSQGCAYAVSPATPSVGADGGAVTVTVTTGSGCPWSSTSDVSWIVPQGASSGSGSGSMTWLVAATSGPSRTGTTTVAGQRITFTQSPGCVFSISPESASQPAAGGTGRVAVTAPAGCAWTAASSAPWLTIASGASGTGNGEVQYSAAATTGPGRSATMTIAGKTFTVNQGQGCTYVLSPTSATIGDNGGPGSFTVQTAAGCAWTAASSVPWITVTPPADGTGEGQVRFTVADNSGPSRSAAVTAGGQTFTVQQGNGCSYSIAPATQSVPAGGATGTVNVTSGSGCGWTATSNASWLSITSGASGTGNAAVRFNAAANAGAARSGTLTIAGRTFTVSQAEGCTFAIAPESASPAAGGGPLSVSVTSPGGCAWTAAAAGSAPWIRVTSGASGSGNGTVELTIDPNSGASRTGTATIAGRTFTVNQGSGCSYSIAPASQGAPATASTLTVDVTSAAGCAWTAASQVPWLTVTSGASGSGNGQVRIDVQANSDPPRSGTATIAGQTYTVNQDSGCTYTVSPEVVGSPAAGSAPRVTVTTAGSCGWTASSGVPWITMTAGSPGTGSGAVDLSVAANSGPARSGGVAVAGRTVTVNQDSGCVYSLSAPSQTVPAAGGGGSVNVTTAAGCAWTAASNAPWIIVTAGSSGSGDGTVTFTVDANATGAPRSGAITIGGQTFTVNQD